MIDAKFDRIQNVYHHPNADSLDIVIVSNYPCITKRDEFNKNDIVFYIREDAKLIDIEEYHKWYKEISKPDVMGPLEYMWRFPWQRNLINYVGTGARVKVIKLRGVISSGIVLRPDEICEHLPFYVGEDNIDEINAKIKDTETGDKFLKDNFGVGHWSAPVGNVGTLDVLHQGLDFGLTKSDEENYENLPDEDLHLGEKCIVTKKLDGTSCTVICQPNGEYSIASRTQTFNVKRMTEDGTENVYTKFTKSAVKAGLWYAKTFNRVIALRGEICCQAVQNFGINKDRELNDFFVYGCEFPEEENWFNKYGVYGTDFHFLKVVDLMRKNGYDVSRVPLLCLSEERTITRELLKQFNDSPADYGEGAVINVKCEDVNQELTSFVWHYKSKSRDYLQRIK